MPSKTSEVYWDNTWGDIQSKLRLKFGYEQVKLNQQLSHLVSVAAAVFGGKKKAPPQPVKNKSEALRSFAAFQRAARGG